MSVCVLASVIGVCYNCEHKWNPSRMYERWKPWSGSHVSASHAMSCLLRCRVHMELIHALISSTWLKSRADIIVFAVSTASVCIINVFKCTPVAIAMIN